MRVARRSIFIATCLLLPFLLAAQDKPAPLEVTRDAHMWEFLDSVGQHAAIFGNESGMLEAWVYPLKFFKGFHLVFHADNRVIPAELLVRTVITRPESTTLVYANDNFSVRETIFAPVNRAGALILLDVDSFTPLEVEAQLEPDVQLSWPASVGGTYFEYNELQHAFLAGADARKLFGVFGSPGAKVLSIPYQTNYSFSNTVALSLGPAAKGRQQFVLAWALSTDNLQTALDTYKDLLANPQQLLRKSAKYYEDYLAKTLNISVPDEQLQSAYDWSRVAIVQGMVDSPGDGYGMVAGYRTSFGYRAGFNWFFGRDSLWTSLALLKEGDFANVKAVLGFLAKYQRDDGKIPHEIAHLAAETDWFKIYSKYAYAAADATPLYLIVAREYLRATGDKQWVRDNWDHLARAYQFLLSTRGKSGWPRNFGVGHGWVEGGPLLPIETEFYLAGLSVEALDAMRDLAQTAGHNDVAQQSAEIGGSLQKQLDTDFWSPKVNALSLGLDLNGKVIDRASILVTAPLWWPLVSDEKAQKTFNALAAPDITSDWGSRIISDRDPVYDPSGYHFGSVWPLFTGWASVADYEYHRPLEGYAQLRQNVLLTHSGQPGHVTEVLSGTYFAPLPGSTPHQIWSSAMVVSPILRGLFGLDARADGSVTLAPHFPATWKAASISNIHAGAAIAAISYWREGEIVGLEVSNTGSGTAQVKLSPGFALTATGIQITVDGKQVRGDLQRTSQDQHATVKLEVAPGSKHRVRFRIKNDFGLESIAKLPPLGYESEGLRFVREQWSNSTASFVVEGRSGQTYLVKIGGDAQVASIDNAEAIDLSGERYLRVRFEGGANAYQEKTVTVHLRVR